MSEPTKNDLLAVAFLFARAIQFAGQGSSAAMGPKQLAADTKEYVEEMGKVLK